MASALAEAFVRLKIRDPCKCHHRRPLPMLFVMLLAVPLLLPLHCAQWVHPSTSHHAQQQHHQQMPLMTSVAIDHGAQHRPHVGCVLCISCCCLCPPSPPPSQPMPFLPPRPSVLPPEQPPLVVPTQPQFNQPGGGIGGGGDAQPFHQQIPFDQQQSQRIRFPFSTQQNPQIGGGNFMGSPTAGYLSPSSGPVQIGSTQQHHNHLQQQQQQNFQQQMSLSEFGTLSATAGGAGEPGILRNFQGDQYTDGQRIVETRELNGPFFERIGGEPNYGGSAAPTAAEIEYKRKEKNN